MSPGAPRASSRRRARSGDARSPSTATSVSPADRPARCAGPSAKTWTSLGSWPVANLPPSHERCRPSVHAGSCVDLALPGLPPRSRASARPARRCERDAELGEQRARAADPRCRRRSGRRSRRDRGPRARSRAPRRRPPGTPMPRAAVALPQRAHQVVERARPARRSVQVERAARRARPSCSS